MKPLKTRWAYLNPGQVIEPPTAKKESGWAAGEKPPNQYMNWIHDEAAKWEDFFEAKTENIEPVIIRSDNPATWNAGTGQLTFTANIQIVFRNGAGAPQINQFNAGSSPLTLADGEVVVVKRDRVGVSPVNLALGAYGSLAAGEYDIIPEASMTAVDEENEMVFARRRGTNLEIPYLQAIIKDASTFEFGIDSAPPHTHNTIDWLSNFGMQASATTTANDTIGLCGLGGSALSASAPLTITLQSDVTGGQSEQFSIDSSLATKISGAHWGIDGTGNLTGAILRVGLINDGGATPALAIYYLGGRTTVQSTKAFSAPASVTLSEHVLVNRALAVGTWPIREIGYFLANFTDATNVWAIQTSEIWAGENADGRWQPYNDIWFGYSSQPVYSFFWTQHGQTVSIWQVASGATGTSNSTINHVSIPVANENFTAGACTYFDNGVVATSLGYVFMQANVLQFYKTPQALNNWTAAGQKSGVLAGIFSYKAQY